MRFLQADDAKQSYVVKQFTFPFIMSCGNVMDVGYAEFGLKIVSVAIRKGCGFRFDAEGVWVTNPCSDRLVHGNERNISSNDFHSVVCSCMVSFMWNFLQT